MISFEQIYVDFKLQDFWDWTNLMSYIQVTLLVGVLAFTTIFIFIDNTVVVESIGYAALLTEAMLALPQFLKNQRNRSVQGMKYVFFIKYTYAM
jgi:branched-subunit amino acid transport protein AzlD